MNPVTSVPDFNFYNELGQKYPESKVVYNTESGKIRLKFVANCLRQIGRKDQKLLDVGCNNYVYEQFWSGLYVGVDIARPLLLQGNRNGVWADCYSLPFKDKVFDCVLASEIIEHVPYRVEALSEIKRTLKDNGQIIVVVPAARQGGPWRKVWMRELDKWDITHFTYLHGSFSTSELTELLEKGGFKVAETAILSPKSDKHLYARSMKSG